MRQPSAWSIKGHPSHRLAPGEGTENRAVYDLFVNNKGIPVHFRVDQKHSNTIGYLTDFYGLDIRRVAKSTYVLAGEWFGDTYLDYIADRLR